MELLSQFLRALIGGRTKKQQEVLDQFTSFVEDRMAYLMEQVKAFQEDYIHVSRRLNEVYDELRRLNERLARTTPPNAGESVQPLPA